MFYSNFPYPFQAVLDFLTFYVLSCFANLNKSCFLVSSLLILLYLFLFYRGLLIARGAPDVYGSMLAVGVVTWLAIQTFLNIGGMINLIPMTGVPLPFISAGGTATLSNLLAMGILVNISKHTKQSRINN